MNNNPFTTLIDLIIKYNCNKIAVTREKGFIIVRILRDNNIKFYWKVREK